MRHFPKSKLPIINTKTSWENYSGEEGTGFLDVYYCDPRSKNYPVRDVRDVKGRNKLEPHYENKTFNCFASCNQPLLRGSIKRKTGYVFFFTKYTGLIKNYKNQYFVTGFYKLGKTGWINDEKPRYAVKASKGKFVAIGEAFPYDKLVNKKILNPRWEKKILSKEQVETLLCYFEKTRDVSKEYSSETRELKQC